MIPTEEAEQAALVYWLELKGYTFTSIPNSTYTTSWKQKAKNKRMGLRPGFPDLVVIANNRFMAIELKRTKGGAPTKAQKQWIEQLNACGIPAKVCRGADEAMSFIKQQSNV